MLTMGDVQRFIDWYRTQEFEVVATNLNGAEIQRGNVSSC